MSDYFYSLGMILYRATTREAAMRTFNLAYYIYKNLPDEENQ